MQACRAGIAAAQLANGACGAERVQQKSAGALAPAVSSCTRHAAQMMGAVVKRYFAQKMGLKPEDICLVSCCCCCKEGGVSWVELLLLLLRRQRQSNSLQGHFRRAGGLWPLMFQESVRALTGLNAPIYLVDQLATAGSNPATTPSLTAPAPALPTCAAPQVSVMPCTAKKHEAEREELRRAGEAQDIDYVITTRELGHMLRCAGRGLGGSCAACQCWLHAGGLAAAASSKSPVQLLAWRPEREALEVSHS